MRAVVLIVAVLALAAVGLFAVQSFPARIEADLKQRSTEALSAANLPFAKVTVNGRAVTLSGEAPSPAAKEQAAKIASNTWGVSTVNDAIVVSAAGQPVTPQSVAAPSATQLAEDTPPEPALSPAPAEEPSSSGNLPSVGSLVDPSLGSSTDEPQETPPAPDETSPTETVAPAPQAVPAPAETAAATPAPAPEPPSTLAPTPTPTQTEPAPKPAESPPQIVAQVTPPPAPVAAPTQPAAKPTSPPPQTAPPAALPKEEIARGVTAGLTTALQSMQQAIAAAPPEYRLNARVDGSQIELQGLVSTPSAQRALIAHVRRHIHRANIVDSLQVAHAKPDKDWLGVARTGLAQLAHLDNGSLKLTGHSVAVSGKPKSEKDRTRLLAALNELPRGYTSTLLLERVQDAQPTATAIAPPPAVAPLLPAPEPVHRTTSRAPEPPKPAHVAKAIVAKYRTVPPPPSEPEERSLSSSCRRRFNDVLPRVAVAFESGSARIESSVGLDDLARIARQCSEVHIRLSGHSDTLETAATATGLSFRRALSVRDALEDRGVSSGNITVLGRGGMRPAFSNATAEGRENNRRVEFAVW
jgi:outer membrane protein OmpA-like peptidoglycan-associated protein